MADDVDVVRRIEVIPDPFDQLRAATARMALAHREVTELSRLRKRVVEELRERGFSDAQIAEAAGLTRGRVHQIRHGGPPAESAFFGIGTVTVAVNRRESSRAYEDLAALLEGLFLGVEPVDIPTSGPWPIGVGVAICGPASSPLVAETVGSDPFLGLAKDRSGRWTLRDRATGEAYSSHVAYLGRLAVEKGSLLLVAGLTEQGAAGAVDHLTRRLPDLYAAVGTRRFSMVVGSEEDGDGIARNEAVCLPRIHDAISGQSLA